MAFIANTAFEQRISNHEFESTANITGKYQASSADADCSAGLLCVRATLMANEGYTNINNDNTWVMNAAGASDLAQKGIYACNPGNVNTIVDSGTGAKYKVGSNTLGLGIPAGDRDTFTKIFFNNDNVYRFGVGNINGTIGSNTIFTIAAGLLVPASAAPTANGAPYFELVGTGKFTQGAYQGFDYYDLRACMTVGSTSASG